MPMTLREKAVEGSTYVITASFFDENDTAVVPASILWSLTDARGDVVNSREDVAVAVPAAVIDIVLSGDDLAVTTGQSPFRRLRVNATYNGPAGPATPLVDEVRFTISALA